MTALLFRYRKELHERSYGLWEKNATGREMKEGVPSSPSLFLLFSLLKVGGSLPWPN